MLSEDQQELLAHAYLASLDQGGVSVDPELEADAEELIERGWLRRAEGTEDEVGYALTDEGRTAVAVAQAVSGASPN